MNLPIVNGRECVPVRLLPFLTAWVPLAPDVVAQLFSWRKIGHRFSISSFNLRPDGKYHPLPPNAWDRIDDNLTVLALDLSRQESFEYQSFPEWERRSVMLLPASVFVWRDELVADYARAYGKKAFLTFRPSAGGRSKEEVEAELEMINRLCQNPDTSKEADAFIERTTRKVDRDTVYRPGDGELNFAPLLSVEEEKIAFEGFESVPVPSQRAARPPQARPEQERVIVDMLKELGYVPTSLPKGKSGKRGVKAEVWERIGTTPLFQSWGTFDKAWQRLRNKQEIGEAQPFLT